MVPGDRPAPKSTSSNGIDLFIAEYYVCIGIILYMRLANERRRYIITPSTGNIYKMIPGCSTRRGKLYLLSSSSWFTNFGVFFGIQLPIVVTFQMTSLWPSASYIFIDIDFSLFLTIVIFVLNDSWFVMNLRWHIIKIYSYKSIRAPSKIWRVPPLKYITNSPILGGPLLPEAKFYKGPIGFSGAHGLYLRAPESLVHPIFIGFFVVCQIVFSWMECIGPSGPPLPLSSSPSSGHLARAIAINISIIILNVNTANVSIAVYSDDKAVRGDDNGTYLSRYPEYFRKPHWRATGPMKYPEQLDRYNDCFLCFLLNMRTDTRQIWEIW